MNSLTLATWLSALLFVVSLYGFIAYFKSLKNKNNDIRWSSSEAISVTLFIYFFSQVFITALILITLSALGWNESRISGWLEGSTVGQFAFMSLIQFMMIGLLVAFLKRRNTSLKSLGLTRRPNKRDVGFAILAYFAYIVAYVLIASVVGSLLSSVDLEQRQQIGYQNVSMLQLPLVFIGLVILPPLVEELIVRGFLYSGLKNRMPHVRAVFITSALFAVAHLQFGSGAPLLWVAAIDTFVLSVVLIRLKDVTGSLWAPIFLHGLKNFVAFLGLFVFRLV